MFDGREGGCLMGRREGVVWWEGGGLFDEREGREGGCLMGGGGCLMGRRGVV